MCALRQVVVVPRKAQSSHPKYSQWPEPAIAELSKQLTSHKEFQIYEAAVEKLASRMDVMKKSGIDVDARVALLRSLRVRVTEVKTTYYCYRRCCMAHIYTYIPTYIHTCIQYIHTNSTYIHTYIHTLMCRMEGFSRTLVCIQYRHTIQLCKYGYEYTLYIVLTSLFIHTFIHTYIRFKYTYIQYIHTYMHTYKHST